MIEFGSAFIDRYLSIPFKGGPCLRTLVFRNMDGRETGVFDVEVGGLC